LWGKLIWSNIPMLCSNARRNWDFGWIIWSTDFNSK
jgi:hypothetical protein